METSLREVLPVFGCSHQFSWPRRSAEGSYYQVCLRCGAQYLYDWSEMRRVRRIEHADSAERRPSLRAGRHLSWRPRARRLAVMIAVKFRACGTPAWHSGTIRNISKSGLLIETSEASATRAQLEMMFEMPREISGQPDCNHVIAKGVVIRTLGQGEQRTHMAVSLSDCRYGKN